MLFTLQSSLKSQSNVGGFRKTYNHPNAVLVGFKATIYLPEEKAYLGQKGELPK